MNFFHEIDEVLCIPEYYCRPLSDDRIMCLVTEKWMRELHQGQIHQLEADAIINKCVADIYLAYSSPTLPSPWIRITVKLWTKDGHQNSQRLPHCSGIGDQSDERELSQVTTNNSSYLKQAEFSPACQHQPMCQQHSQPPKCDAKFGQASISGWRQALIDLCQPKVHIDLSDRLRHDKHGTCSFTSKCLESRNTSNPSESNFCRKLVHHSIVDFLDGVLHVLALIETELTFLIVQPYKEHSLRDAVLYSPALLGVNYTKSLFVIYQVLQAMAAVHTRGLRFGNLTLDHVFVETDLFATVLFPRRLSVDSMMALQSRCRRPVSEVTGNVRKCTGENPHRCALRCTPERINCNYVGNDLRKFSQVDHLRCGHLSTPITSQYTDDAMEQMFIDGCRCLHEKRYVEIVEEGITKAVDAWVNRKISNFMYLLALNHFGRRKMNDPNNHPVLPWVMDFSCPYDGFRDLTKSKYRLNKGDGQLDFQYSPASSHTIGRSSNGESLTTPHHVPDVLSDITYYVYKCRRLQQSVLCSNVRSAWVPREYPASIQRLYEWTPDECIPEFFTDQEVFQSIHSDLPNLTVPEWCDSTRQFLIHHMAVLESDLVTSQLHHWIDLTFGYKLSGAAAVSAKNVNLQLVDGHQCLRCNGVLQLFTHPHPHRLSSRSHVPISYVENIGLSQNEYTLGSAVQDKGTEGQAVSTDTTVIKLPLNFDPLLELNHYETAYDFKCSTCSTAGDLESSLPSVQSPCQDVSIKGDIASLLCVVAEMFLAPKMLLQVPSPPLPLRLASIKSLCHQNMSLIPRPFLKAVMFLLNQFKTDLMSSSSGIENDDVNISSRLSCRCCTTRTYQLHHLQSDLFSFPPFFPSMYTCFCYFAQTDTAIVEVKWGWETDTDKDALMRRLARSKLPVLEEFLLSWRESLGREGLLLVLPLVESLLSDKLLNSQSALRLFGLIFPVLGPSLTLATFLPSFLSLFNEASHSSTCAPLYHWKYLTQMIHGFHLQPFLHHFSTLLVEAVAGFRDVLSLCHISRQEDSSDTSSYAGSENKHVTPSNCSASNDVFIDRAVNETCDGGMLMCGQEGVGLVTCDTEDDVFLLQDSDEVDFALHGENFDSDNGALVEEERCSIHSISNILCKVAHQSVIVDGDEISGDREAMLRTNSSSQFCNIECFDGATRQVFTSNIDCDVQSHSNSSVHSCLCFSYSEMGCTRDDNLYDQPAKPNDFPCSSSSFKSTDESHTYHDSSDNAHSYHDEFTHPMTKSSLIHPSVGVSISDLASESVKQLAAKIGPVLATRHLSRNLLRVLSLCYFGQTMCAPFSHKVQSAIKTSRGVVGDMMAVNVVECLQSIASLYGEHIILIQYIPSILDMMRLAQRYLTENSEAGLLSSVVLMRFIVPFLSDKIFMDIIDETIVARCVAPAVKLLLSQHATFPGGSVCRLALCHKLIDLMYVLGLRMGLEMTRRFLRQPMLLLMDAFSIVYDGLSDIVASHSEFPPPGESSALQQANDPAGVGIEEIYAVFTPDLALSFYIPFSRIFGGIYLEESLRNEGLIRHLCEQQDHTTAAPFTGTTGDSIGKADSGVTSCIERSSLCEDLSSSVEVVGNQIRMSSKLPDRPLLAPSSPREFACSYHHDGILQVTHDELYSNEMESNKERHLGGNWLQYWEYELGLHARDNSFSFKQIRLQSFHDHSNSIRCLQTMDTESCFISSSKDKTVRLWSLSNHGDGNGRVPCKWTYRLHKKSVFSVTYVESAQKVASCDSEVHIWDPYTGNCVRKLESSKYSPVIALKSIPAPSTLVAMGTTDSTLRFLDLRSCEYVYNYHCSLSLSGVLRCIEVCPEPSWVAVGFSTGVISVFEIDTGFLISSWKGHEGEILQNLTISKMKACGKQRLVSSSLDGTMRMWSVDRGTEICQLKGHGDPVHCIDLYLDHVVSGTTSNRIAVHSPAAANSQFNAVKLRSDAFKGVLTSMAVLPLNKTLLLGSNQGVIHLFA